MDSFPSHYLYPAALFTSKEPYIVNTILGSCVAICLWDSVLKYGGINHFMLPLWNGEGLASPKYGNIAVERLVEKMTDYGCSIRNLKAKVFGGGEVLETQSDQFNIGQRNIDLAFSSLKDYKILITANSVGGKKGRKIQFNTHTGEVKMKYIEKSLNVKST